MILTLIVRISMDFMKRWIVLEPIMMLETFTFGAFVTQQSVYRQKIKEDNPGASDEVVDDIASNFFRSFLFVNFLYYLFKYFF